MRIGPQPPAGSGKPLGLGKRGGVQRGTIDNSDGGRIACGQGGEREAPVRAAARANVPSCLSLPQLYLLCVLRQRAEKVGRKQLDRGGTKSSPVRYKKYVKIILSGFEKQGPVPQSKRRRL